MHAPLTPELLLQGYRQGIFPMAESRDAAEIHWVDPYRRGILPMGRLHVSRSLRRRMRARPFSITFDRDFAGVLAGCAEREETWISAPIAGLYEALHARGAAHSIETWERDALVGGVYGVRIGAAFFGESMFSRRTDASKIALAYLMERLMAGGFTLFDTQFMSPHLQSLGAVEVSRDSYHEMLNKALGRPARFDADAPLPEPDQVWQRITQMS